MRRVVLAGIAVAFVSLAHGAWIWAGDDASAAAHADSKRAFDAARRGYWLEALALWEGALVLVPDDPEILNNYAVALEAVGRYEEAGPIYEKAITIDADRRIRKNYQLNREFYVSYVLRKDEESREEPDDDETSVPQPVANEEGSATPPEADAGEGGRQGGDDD